MDVFMEEKISSMIGGAKQLRALLRADEKPSKSRTKTLREHTLQEMRKNSKNLTKTLVVCKGGPCAASFALARH